MKKKEVVFVISLFFLFFIVVVSLKTGIILSIENDVYNFLSKFITPLITVFVKILTNIGGPFVIVPLCSILIFFKNTRKKFGIPVIITLGVSYIINFILKNIFSRPRPNILRLINETSYSFPSGHSMINAAIYTILILILLKKYDNRVKGLVISILFIILFVLIGLSRIYLGVHYLGDVLAGWILGVLVAYVVYIIMNKIENKNGA